LVFGGNIGAPGEKDGGGLTGVALSGDVMDNVGNIVTLQIGSSYVSATASTRSSYLRFGKEKMVINSVAGFVMIELYVIED